MTEKQEAGCSTTEDPAAIEAPVSKGEAMGAAMSDSPYTLQWYSDLVLMRVARSLRWGWLEHTHGRRDVASAPSILQVKVSLDDVANVLAMAIRERGWNVFFDLPLSRGVPVSARIRNNDTSISVRLEIDPTTFSLVFGVAGQCKPEASEPEASEPTASTPQRNLEAPEPTWFTLEEIPYTPEKSDESLPLHPRD